MAIGFPTKANWAAGDVLTASALDDLAGTVNLLSNASAASGSQLVSNVAGTSLAYVATPSSSNPVLNASMSTWQRGTSFAATGNAYTADRWQCYRGGIPVTVSRQSTALTGIQYGARVQRDSGNTFTTAVTLGQPVETVNSIPFAGKTITLSFYAKAGANFSAASSQIVVNFYTGTGTDENYISGYTGQVLALAQSQAITTTYTRYSATFALASNITEMAPVFSFTPVGTAGANDWFEVTGVQIDIGSVALPFRTYAATFQGELMACQRYYERRTAGGANYGMGISVFFTSGTAGTAALTFASPKRTSPSVAFSGITANSGSTGIAVSTMAGTYSSGTSGLGFAGGGFDFTVASGGTDGRGGALRDSGAGTGYIEFNSEL